MTVVVVVGAGSRVGTVTGPEEVVDEEDDDDDDDGPGAVELTDGGPKWARGSSTAGGPPGGGTRSRSARRLHLDGRPPAAGRAGHDHHAAEAGQRDDAGDSQPATAEGAPEPHASIIRAGPDTLGEAARICPLFAVAGRWNNLKVALR